MRGQTIVLLLYAGDMVIVVLKNKGTSAVILKSFVGLWLLAIVALVAEALAANLGAVLMGITTVSILVGSDLGTSTANIINGILGGKTTTPAAPFGEPAPPTGNAPGTLPGGAGGIVPSGPNAGQNYQNA